MDPTRELRQEKTEPDQIPDPRLIDSMAMRYRHDFGLLEESHKDAIRVTMTQIWEEVVGIGFYQYPDPVPPALCPDRTAMGLWDLYAKEASSKEIADLSPKQAFMIGVSMAYAHYRYRWPKT